MAENRSSMHMTPSRSDTLVVLFAPEALGKIDTEALNTTLRSAKQPVRVLIHLVSADGKSVGKTFEHAGVQTDWLLGPGVQQPSLARFVHMPDGSQPAEQEDFALAMSDVIITAPGSENLPLMNKAKSFGKPLILLGQDLPSWRPTAGVTRKLDPEAPGWNALGRRTFGRLEQLLMEILAINWLGMANDGIIESGKRIWKSCNFNWSSRPYFAPNAWHELIPDRDARSAAAPIWVKFDELDRSALYGSYIHRDLVWVVHLAAAFAVFAAVAGELWKGAWPIAELIALLLVTLLIVFAQTTRLQDRWTACRLGAEQLRIARMCLPLLVVPPALRSVDQKNESGQPIVKAKTIAGRFFAFVKPKETPDLMLQVLAEVKRAVREQGLPSLHSDTSPTQAAEWLKLIVADQTRYHDRNRRILEHVERRLLWITTGLFMAAITSVILHFFVNEEWLLLFTASGPAFAAAVHGTETRLGIVHRKALSEAAEKELEPIHRQLQGLIDQPPMPAHAWLEVRRLALNAADAMGRENTSWHGLVRRERDGLPA